MGETFWPNTLNETLTVIGIILGAIGVVWRFVHKPLVDRVAGQAVKLKGHDTRLEIIERQQAMANVDRTNLHEALARLTVETQTLMKVMQDTQLMRMNDLIDIRERLVRIETKVDFKHRGDDEVNRRGESGR